MTLVIPTVTVLTNYIVKAICLNEAGDEVTRKLGLVRGMTDSGQPGWTAHSPMTFPSVEAAAEYLRSPALYSIYDGHYKNGRVWMVRQTVKTHTIEVEVEVDYWGPSR